MNTFEEGKIKMKLIFSMRNVAEYASKKHVIYNIYKFYTKHIRCEEIRIT